MAQITTGKHLGKLFKNRIGLFRKYIFFLVSSGIRRPSNELCYKNERSVGLEPQWPNASPSLNEIENINKK